MRDAVPKESSVHFWMGRLCKKVNRLDEAVQHFTAAQDLNPKDNAVRAALERLTEPDLPEGESQSTIIAVHYVRLTDIVH